MKDWYHFKWNFTKCWSWISTWLKSYFDGLGSLQTPPIYKNACSKSQCPEPLWVSGWSCKASWISKPKASQSRTNPQRGKQCEIFTPLRVPRGLYSSYQTKNNDTYEFLESNPRSIPTPTNQPQKWPKLTRSSQKSAYPTRRIDPPRPRRASASGGFVAPPLATAPWAAPWLQPPKQQSANASGRNRGFRSWQGFHRRKRITFFWYFVLLKKRS